MQNRKINRAKQFMPFAALKGYFDLIKTCEKIKEDKKELSEHEAEKISNTLNKLQKGMLVEITYYNIDFYNKIKGIISEIDKNYKVLSIIKKKIKFCDIIEIQIIN